MRYIEQYIKKNPRWESPKVLMMWHKGTALYTADAVDFQFCVSVTSRFPYVKISVNGFQRILQAIRYVVFSKFLIWRLKKEYNWRPNYEHNT